MDTDNKLNNEQTERGTGLTNGTGSGQRGKRRALLRRAKAVGVATLDDHELAAIVDHRCAEYVRRTSRLPSLRDAGANDYGDPGRLRLAAAIELGRRTLAAPERRNRWGRDTAAAYHGGTKRPARRRRLVWTRKRLLEAAPDPRARDTDETLADRGTSCGLS